MNGHYCALYLLGMREREWKKNSFTRGKWMFRDYFYTRSPPVSSDGFCFLYSVFLLSGRIQLAAAGVVSCHKMRLLMLLLYSFTHKILPFSFSHFGNIKNHCKSDNIPFCSPLNDATTGKNGAERKKIIKYLEKTGRPRLTKNGKKWKHANFFTASLLLNQKTERKLRAIVNLKCTWNVHIICTKTNSSSFISQSTHEHSISVEL